MVKLMIINDKLELIAASLSVQFTLKGEAVSYQRIFAKNGLLPQLSKRAEQVSQLSLGCSLGAKYEEDQDALGGLMVQFDDFTPLFLRLMCLTDVLCELINMSSDRHLVALDELLYD